MGESSASLQLRSPRAHLSLDFGDPKSAPGYFSQPVPIQALMLYIPSRNRCLGVS